MVMGVGGQAVQLFSVAVAAVKKVWDSRKKTKLYSPRWTQYGSSMENGSQECRMTALLQSIGEVQSNKLWPYFSFNLNAGGQLFRTVSSGSDERR